jgi:predicted nucleic acid-binding protein
MTASEPPDVQGPLYFDASALGRLYIPGQESRRMKADLAGRVDLFVSDLGVTEMASALSPLRREGYLSSVNARKVYNRLLDDIATGIFERVELASEIHRTTEHRLLAFGDSGLRAGDALHLGLAIGSGCLCMVSYDRRLADVCRHEGLMVYPS